MYMLSHFRASSAAHTTALLDNPYCLILDEPTANLDPVNVEGITKLITDIEVPIKIVITHHYTDEYLNSFDEVIDFNKLK